MVLRHQLCCYEVIHALPSTKPIRIVGFACPPCSRDLGKTLQESSIRLHQALRVLSARSSPCADLGRGILRAHGTQERHRHEVVVPHQVVQPLAGLASRSGPSLLHVVSLLILTPSACWASGGRLPVCCVRYMRTETMSAKTMPAPPVDVVDTVDAGRSGVLNLPSRAPC